MQLKGKVVLVTGAARGIGEAVAVVAKERGAKAVVIADVLVDDGQKVAQRLNDSYGAGSALFLRVDVTSHTSFETAVRRCVDEFGGLDVVVNNAGIIGEDCWEAQMQINLMGSIRGCQLGVRYMRSPGTIVNVASIQGLLHWPAMPTYSAGKAGLVAYTRCAGHPAAVAAHNIRHLCLCPFGVDTPMNKTLEFVGMTKEGKNYLESLDVFGEILTAREVGEAVADLIESAASTGSVWYLNKHGEKPFEVPDELPSLDKLLSYAK